MRPETLERYPAFAASLLLHAGVVIAALVLGTLLNKPVFGPNVTNVTLISDAQNPAPGIPAPTPTPTIAPPEPPAPEVAPTPPTPTPPAPSPNPARPTPVKPTPAPSKPQPKPAPTAPSKTPTKPTAAAPNDDDFLSNLSKSLSHGAKPAPSPAHPSTRPNPGTGTAPSAAAQADIARQLGELWNPNCSVLGGADVEIIVTAKLGGGRISDVTSSGSGSSDPLVKAASDRAVRAVYRLAGDPNRPLATWGDNTYHFPFHSKQACANR